MKVIVKVALAFFISGILALPQLKMAEAFNWIGLASSVINSSAQRASIMNMVNYYDNGGREELFSVYKDNLMAKDNPELNELLADVVERLSMTVAETEISVIERPYNFFIVPSEQFNAACGLGHTMFVNEGVFSFVNNDEDMLAAVVAHEMVHGQQDHNVKGIKNKMNTLFAHSVIGSQLKGYGSYFLLDLAAIHIINSGVTKPSEWEANNLLYAYLTDSGYNLGAPAALWQKVTETAEMKPGKRNVLKSVLNPATHPSSKDRRDNFALKLTEHSQGKIKVENSSGSIFINNQFFMLPADTEEVSSRVRSYLIAGNLASLYKEAEQAPSVARAEEDKVIVNEVVIVQVTENDPSAAELATTFNQIS